MKAKYMILVLLFSIASFAHTAVSAQNIRNDTVFVSTNALVELIFNDKKKSGAEIIDNNGSYELGGTKRSFTVKALQKDAQPKKLIVKEGQRKHDFILVYSESVPESQMVVDWSNLKKLKEHVKAKEEKANGKLEVADALYNKGEFLAALSMFHALKEEVDISKVGLVESRITSIEEQLQKIYMTVISKGDHALSEKKFKEAWDAYKEALAYFPGNENATKKFKEVSPLAFKESIRKAQDANEEKRFAAAKNFYEDGRNIDPETFARNNQKAYETVLKQEIGQHYKQLVDAGDDAAEVQDWSKAKMHYDSALKLKVNESVLVNKMQKANQEILKLDNYNKKEAEYYSVLSKAKLLAAKALNVADHEVAIDEYKKASALFPERRFPKDKIAEIQKRRRNDSVRN
ncbi:MAG: hypothetical protein EOO10_01495 [Chitinophagaceae bacterium]|nr:MAG: hypothetical protein EOO10_01495 [Chitinophagaceae bacterium]